MHNTSVSHLRRWGTAAAIVMLFAAPSVVVAGAASADAGPAAPVLAYVSGGQLNVVATDGTGARSLGPSSGDRPPAWSPKGDWLAVTTPGGIMASRLDGSD